ncbi:MAG: alcohol dehydrogenase catalytic domain-containing protein [Sphaerochaetaceae bacterium]|nr:alcohol dehydrogenase catalytic domain-containing protein [Sphaerochaetaceae bacterium]
MLNSIYKLVSPRYFEKYYYDIGLNSDKIIVRPTHLSICNADQRYYQGLRDKQILRKKLPMALIHEGIGEVVYDPTNTYKVNERVVMIPNNPTEKNSVIRENYLRSSLFCSSSRDGFMQEYIPLNKDRIVKLPDFMPNNVAAFTELVTVSYHVIERFNQFSHQIKNTIGVFGDGNLGFITALLLKKIFPTSQIYVFGIHPNKLHNFSFADKTFNSYEIPEDVKIDHAFECVGGNSSSIAINQIIDIINPQGTISLMGVSEDNASVNTRMVLEKGLVIFGSSRSGRADFVGLIELYKKHPDIVEYLENIVGTEILIKNIHDIKKAFEIDINKEIGKTILIWDERKIKGD